MAKFSANGFDELAAELKKLGQLGNGELVEEMLNAGAEVVVREWKNGIQKVVKTKRSKGELLESIGTGKGVEKVGDVSTATIYPVGQDSKGVHNAEKAFILHYGKSGQTPTFFVDDVEAAAEDEVVEAMSDVFNNFCDKFT